MPPPGTRQPPSDFDTRRERRLKGGHRKTNEPDEGRLTWHFHCPWPIAVGFEVLLDPSNQPGSFLTRKREWKMLHHLRIGVKRCKRLQIFGKPAAQTQPWCCDLDTGRRHQKSRCRIPRSRAIVTACVRSDASSFARMFWICILIVPLAVPSWCAISLFA